MPAPAAPPMLSPCSTDLDIKWYTSEPPDSDVGTSSSNMLKIQSLLNPSASDDSALHHSPKSPRPLLSTGYASQEPLARSTPRSATPSTPGSSKRFKANDYDAMLNRGDIEISVNYPPFESLEDDFCLTVAEREELARQHKLFDIKPRGEDKIGDHPKHIPYSSDKKSFGGKTGREGFDVFWYTFKVPHDPDNVTYEVMWDYQNGLVRITPFFKACKHSKTTPAKALNANSGLKELSHSITGGALRAQGYWVPYNCARALCITFCYSIRWALSPIFGPSIVRDCLRQSDPAFGRFIVSTESIRGAQLEAEGWVSTPSSTGTANAIPRSVPEETNLVGGKELRPRNVKPTFKVGSPFDYDEASLSEEYDDSFDVPSSAHSPKISPRSSVAPTSTPTWTSINRLQTPTSPMTNTTSVPLSHSLLTQPHYGSWRPATTGLVVKEDTESVEKSRYHGSRKQPMVNVKREAKPKPRRRRDHHGPRVGESDSDNESTGSASSISVDQQSQHSRKDDASTSARFATSPTTHTSAKSKKYAARDFRAAWALLALSRDDAKLGMERQAAKENRERKRRASSSAIGRES